MSDKKKKWIMPEWMESYRDLICNTGGNSIEELMNDHHSTVLNNAIRAGIIVSVDAQIILLIRLKKSDY